MIATDGSSKRRVNHSFTIQNLKSKIQNGISHPTARVDQSTTACDFTAFNCINTKSGNYLYLCYCASLNYSDVSLGSRLNPDSLKNVPQNNPAQSAKPLFFHSLLLYMNKY
jgi:hypothetical protein